MSAEDKSPTSIVAALSSIFTSGEKAAGSGGTKGTSKWSRAAVVQLHLLGGPVAPTLGFYPPPRASTPPPQASTPHPGLLPLAPGFYQPPPGFYPPPQASTHVHAPPVFCTYSCAYLSVSLPPLTDIYWYMNASSSSHVLHHSDTETLIQRLAALSYEL